MAVTILLANGSQQRINGRASKIIEWFVLHHEEWAKYDRVEYEIHCKGDRVTIAPKMIEELAPARD